MTWSSGEGDDLDSEVGFLGTYISTVSRMDVARVLMIQCDYAMESRM